MSDYRLNITNPIPLILLKPESVTKVRGIEKKNYTKIEDALKNKENIFFGSFKTYGGTEKTINDIYVIEDTATIETWYRPDITSSCRIARTSDNAVFEIINEPEDINQRHQFLKFKVKRIKGGA